MPTANVYFLKSQDAKEVEKHIKELKGFLSVRLTCGDKKLTPAEISLRFIKVSGGQMIGNIEIEINAHAFPERVNNQDKICLAVMKYVQQISPSLGEVKVWLKLCELGHSWQE